MARFKPERLSTKEKYGLLKEFWTTLALLEDVEQIQNFLKDLLSETEAVMLARRLKIAKLIYQGKSYEAIEKLMHASPTTIASVHSWLDGGFGGYLQGIQKLREELGRQAVLQEKKEQSLDPLSLEGLKKRYPLHFLLFNTADEMKYRAPKRLRKKH
ncbi:MAG: Trp family transcriptional regulator [bacterium]|nr:Trp family transcriptional regulator [bacterium]